jgi:hypothetical protein
MYRPDKVGEFATRVTTLVSHGIEMPPEYDAAQRRLDDFLTTTQTTPSATN